MENLNSTIQIPNSKRQECSWETWLEQSENLNVKQAGDNKLAQNVGKSHKKYWHNLVQVKVINLITFAAAPQQFKLTKVTCHYVIPPAPPQSHLYSILHNITFAKETVQLTPLQTSSFKMKSHFCILVFFPFSLCTVKSNKLCTNKQKLPTCKVNLWCKIKRRHKDASHAVSGSMMIKLWPYLFSNSVVEGSFW